MLEAARLRLRPIVMTSIAFIMGVLPLVTADGAGQEVRRAMGAAVFSGMIGVTVFGLMLTPVFFVLLRRDAARKAELPAPQTEVEVHALRHILRLVPIAPLSLILAACAVGPNYHAPETKAGRRSSTASRPPTPPRTVSRDSGRTSTTRRSPGWSTRRTTSNYDVRIALSRVAEARALRRDSAFDLAPSITAGGGYTKTRFAQDQAIAGTPRDNELYDAGFDAFWELDFFGRVRRGLEASNAELDAVEAAQRDALVIVTAEVTRTYFELRGFQQQLDVARRNVANQQSTLDLANARLDAGSGTEFDTARAQAQLSATLGTIGPLEAAVARSIHRLSVLVGTRTAAHCAPSSRPRRICRRCRASCRWAIRPACCGAGPISASPNGSSRAPRRAWASRSPICSRASPSPAAPAMWRRPLAAWATAAPTPTRWRPESPGPSSISATFRRGSRPRQVAQGRRAPAVRTDRAAGARGDRKLTGHPRPRARPPGARRGGLRASNTAAGLARVRYENGASDFLQVLDAERTLLESEDRLARSRTEAATSLIAVYKALGGGWQTGSSPQLRMSHPWTES